MCPRLPGPLQIHSRPQTPAYRGQTNKYLPSTFVEVSHSSTKQSAVPTNLTSLLVNEIKPRKMNTQEARSS